MKVFKNNLFGVGLQQKKLEGKESIEKFKRMVEIFETIEQNDK